jgi:hypothetical protein
MAKKKADSERNSKGQFTPTHGAYCQHFRKRFAEGEKIYLHINDLEKFISQHRIETPQFS